MLDLANKYWDWRTIQSEKQRSKDAEKETMKEARKKYGLYMDKAKGVSSNKPADTRLDKTFEECIESGVLTVSVGEHYCLATFQNGWSVKFWIANKMYGYCSNDTVFQKPNAERLAFSHTMPSMYMCYYIHEKIEQFSSQ